MNPYGGLLAHVRPSSQARWIPACNFLVMLRFLMLGKSKLIADLLHIAEETRDFDPPYIPRRFLQDVANSDPEALVLRYVLAKDMTSGFHRLWEEKRLDLTVENVAWRHRKVFPPKVGRAAGERLAACGFDVRTQRHVAQQR